MDIGAKQYDKEEAHFLVLKTSQKAGAQKWASPVV
jgi:hypothetical protein